MKIYSALSVLTLCSSLWMAGKWFLQDFLSMSHLLQECIINSLRPSHLFCLSPKSPGSQWAMSKVQEEGPYQGCHQTPCLKYKSVGLTKSIIKMVFFGSYCCSKTRLTKCDTELLETVAINISIKPNYN